MDNLAWAVTDVYSAIRVSSLELMEVALFDITRNGEHVNENTPCDKKY
jgi:hypothetical protein